MTPAESRHERQRVKSECAIVADFRRKIEACESVNASHLIRRFDFPHVKAPRFGAVSRGRRAAALLLSDAATLLTRTDS
jgi:hypothetical protein